MRILAIDLSSHTGFAIGDTDGEPRCGTLELPKTGEDVGTFLLAFDWLQTAPSPARRDQLLTAAGFFLGLVALTSTGLWLNGLAGHVAAPWAVRNLYPLGHPNYTAGLALLMLPLFTALAIRDCGARRAGFSK